MLLSIIQHALEIYYHGWFITHHPSIVARWQHAHIAGLTVKFGSVIHPNTKDA